MPIFKPDPKKATSGFLTYPKGTYRVAIGEPKSFLNAGKNGKADNYGVRFGGTVITSDVPSFVGKPFPIQLFQHTEGACNYSKGVQLAALGCKKDEEFDQKYGDLDWMFNTDDQSAGEGWWKMKGQVMDVDVGESEPDGNGDEKTGNMRFRPI